MKKSKIKVVAIGDIHGNAIALKKLLDRFLHLWKWDQIVFMGDYIDEGKNSYQVIEEIICLQKKYPGRVICLKGNHEQWMLKALEDPQSTSWLIGMNGMSTIASYSLDLYNEFKTILEDLGAVIFREKEAGWRLPFQKFFHEIMPEDHLHFFCGLQNYYSLQDVIFVHAGVKPGISIENQEESDLLWITEEFYKNYNGEKYIIFGHSNTKRLRKDGEYQPFLGKNKIIGIDTGCRRKGFLTAYLWPDGDFLSV